MACSITITSNRVCSGRLDKTLHRDSLGFSLVELLVAIAIIGILTTIALPSFQSTIETSRLKAATNDMVAALSQTRALAIKEGARVSMCMSSNGIQCAVVGNWEQGWIIFSDPVRKAPWLNANVDAGDSINLYSQAIAGNIVIKGNATVSQYVSYAADGQSKTLNGAFLAGTVRVCSTSTALQNNARARDIVINSTGRVVVRAVANATSECVAPN